MKGLFSVSLYLFVPMGILISCEDDGSSQVLQSDLDQLKAEIMDLIADKSCQGAGDCTTIAFGAKPCGGPASFLVFAQSKVTQSLLEDKVNAYNQLEHQFNVENGLVSDCAVVSPPEVGCEDEKCAALPD